MAPIILAEATSTLINKFRRWRGSAHTRKKNVMSNKQKVTRDEQKITSIEQKVASN